MTPAEFAVAVRRDYPLDRMGYDLGAVVQLRPEGMTVGDLKKALEALADSTPVIVAIGGISTARHIDAVQLVASPNLRTFALLSTDCRDYEEDESDETI